MPVQPPWLSSLPASARLAYPAVQRGVREGLSSRRLSAALSDAGIPIRRQTLLDMMRFEKGIQDSGSIFSKVAPDFVVPAARLPLALHPLSDSFSYTVRVVGSLISSGQQFIQHVTVTSAVPLSPEDIGLAAEEAATSKGVVYEMDIQETEIVRGVRSPSRAI